MEEKGKPVTVTSLSQSFSVSKSTVSNMIKKLVVMKLIDTQPYKPIILTSMGRERATEIIHKHRLIELYLVKKMNLIWTKSMRLPKRLSTSKTPNSLEEFRKFWAI